MIHAASLLLMALAQATPMAPTPAASPTPKPLPAGPVVVLETNLGAIKIGLHKDKAPLTVANFIKYVQAKHYDGTIFHRVMPNFMIQGGGYDVKGGYDPKSEKVTMAPIRNEARNGLRNSRGTIAMARTGDPNSATAQFFINVKDNHQLDFGISGAGYAVFGEVLEGMDVVDKIVSVPTLDKGPAFANAPVVPVVIKSARELGGAPAPAPKPAASTAPKPRPSASPSPK